MTDHYKNTKKAFGINGLFLITIIAIFLFLGFDKVFFLGPRGIHFMRQTDSLSFVSQYFNEGFNFFNPKLFNLKNIDGRAACEFPIIYYLTAILYTIIGKKVFLLKLLHLIIIYLGIYYIFKLSYLLIQDYFYATIISLFLFTSTVFNYYSFNYLPDIPALGFTFIAWFFIFKYQIYYKNKNIIISFLFFTLSSLIKITYLINPITVILYFIYSYFFTKKINIKTIKTIMFYSIILLIIVAIWNIYMLYYNKLYGGLSFNTKALPIWNLSYDNIYATWKHIVNYVYVDYFAPFLYYLIAILILLQIVFNKNLNKMIFILSLILFLGVLAYFLLFFKQFKNHDYYFLNFAPLIILILINSFITLKNIKKKKYIDIIIKVFLLIIVIAGINYSKYKLAYRHWASVDDFSRIGLLIEDNIEDINKLNISDNAKFIVVPDYCQNGGLFFLNKMGWHLIDLNSITTETLNYYKNIGANYLLLTTDEKKVLSVAKQNGNLIFYKNGIYIFNLGLNQYKNN